MVISMDRARRIAIEGSPLFTSDVGGLAASAQTVIDLENDAQGEAKYLPMDTLIIKNSSASDVRISAGTQRTTVMANTSSKLSDSIGFKAILIVNLDAVNAIAANAIRLSYNKAPLSEDEKIRRQAFATKFPEQSIFQTGR